MANEISIELPEKHQQRLDDVAAVEPTVHDQIETIVLPQILSLINDAYHQLEPDDRTDATPADESD